MTLIFLTFFEIGVLFNEFFLTVAGKADGEFGLVARPFAPEYEATAVLCMADIRARYDVVSRGADIPFRIGRGPRT